MRVLGHNSGKKHEAIFYSLLDGKELAEIVLSSLAVSARVQEVEKIKDVLHVGVNELYECAKLSFFCLQEIADLASPGWIASVRRRAVRHYGQHCIIGRFEL